MDARVDVLDRLSDGVGHVRRLDACQRPEAQLQGCELLQAVVVQPARPAAALELGGLEALELGGLDAAFERLRLDR